METAYSDPKSFIKNCLRVLIYSGIFIGLFLIARPDFSTGTTRPKVDRVRADHRTLAIAIEAYIIEHNAPPERLAQLEGQPLLDPFTPDYDREYFYFAPQIEGADYRYIIASRGPDEHYETFYPLLEEIPLLTYDPSNGTVSRGDIFWIGRYDE